MLVSLLQLVVLLKVFLPEVESAFTGCRLRNQIVHFSPLFLSDRVDFLHLLFTIRVIVSVVETLAPVQSKDWIRQSENRLTAVNHLFVKLFEMIWFNEV